MLLLISVAMALADIRVPTSTSFAVAVTISCVFALIIAYHNYKLALDDWENHIADDDPPTSKWVIIYTSTQYLYLYTSINPKYLFFSA